MSVCTSHSPNGQQASKQAPSPTGVHPLSSSLAARQMSDGHPEEVGLDAEAPRHRRLPPEESHHDPPRLLQDDDEAEANQQRQPPEQPHRKRKHKDDNDDDEKSEGEEEEDYGPPLPPPGQEQPQQQNDRENNPQRESRNNNNNQRASRWGPKVNRGGGERGHPDPSQSRRPPYDPHHPQSSSSLQIRERSRSNLYIPPAKRRRMEQEKLQREQEQKKQRQQQEENEEDEEGALSDLENKNNQQTLATSSNNNNSLQIQQDTWLAQSRKIHGCINRLSVTNIKERIVDVLQNVNLIRLRGCLAHSLLQAMTSTASQQYLSLYASFLAVLHSKLPAVGQVAVHRLVHQFRLAYQRRDKARVTSLAQSLGHLFVHAVVHELLVLQLLTLLLTGGGGGATNDSLGIAVSLLEIVGGTLHQVSPAGYRAILDQMRAILASQRDLHPQMQQQLQHLLQHRPEFELDPRLDLVELEDQITLSELDLDQDTLDTAYELDAFQYDDDYEQHEREWAAIRKELLGLDDDDDDSDGDGETEDEEEEEEAEEEETAEDGGKDDDGKASTLVQVQDLTEADLVHLRRTIYLTIMSSATFEECAHKLASIDIPEGREEELVNMLLECCAQERTFLRYYGLIGARFCLLNDRWKNAFVQAFGQQYATIHRLETNKLRNVAKLFAHLLYTHALPWSVFTNIRMTEDATTSSSRIFCKILLQEMAQALGIPELKKQFRLDESTASAAANPGGNEKNSTTQPYFSRQGGSKAEHEAADPSTWFQGLFPMQGNLRETRYAINFLTSIGLGPLTDAMRAYLKNAPAIQAAQEKKAAEEAAAAAVAKANDSDASSVLSSSSSSVSSSSSSSLSSSSSEDSETSSSDDDDSRYDRKRRQKRSRRKTTSSSRRRRSDRDRKSDSRRSRRREDSDDHESDDEPRRSRGRGREKDSSRGQKDREDTRGRDQKDSEPRQRDSHSRRKQRDDADDRDNRRRSSHQERDREDSVSDQEQRGSSRRRNNEKERKDSGSDDESRRSNDSDKSRSSAHRSRRDDSDRSEDSDSEPRTGRRDKRSHRDQNDSRSDGEGNEAKRDSSSRSRLRYDDEHDEKDQNKEKHEQSFDGKQDRSGGDTGSPVEEKDEFGRIKRRAQGTDDKDKERRDRDDRQRSSRKENRDRSDDEDSRGGSKHRRRYKDKDDSSDASRENRGRKHRRYDSDED